MEEWQLIRRGFLLHEAVGMCCMLCDNVGRSGVDEDGVNLGDCVRQRIPEPAKSHPSCPVKGDPGVNCVVKLSRHRSGVQAGERGVAEE